MSANGDVLERAKALIANDQPSKVPVKVVDEPQASEPPTETIVTSKARPLSKYWTTRYLVIAAVILVFVILIAVVINLLGDRSRLEARLNQSASGASAAHDNEAAALAAQIGKVFELPVGETPVLVTVSDAAKVNSQQFFKQARDGDKVLLYSKAGTAILYRPSSKKIVNVAPISPDSSPAVSR
jgi:hypothetical protein